MSFEQLGISKQLCEALPAQGITQPFPIQKNAIPLILKGKNVLGIAPNRIRKNGKFYITDIRKTSAFIV